MVAPVTDLAPARPSLPNPNRLHERFKDVADHLARLNDALVRELERRLHVGRPIDDLLLRSPGNKIYRLVVADDGTLSTVLVHG
jgi:hypothetical protein